MASILADFIKLNSYKSTKNKNGTFNIFNVPLFGELDKNERMNKEKIGSSWHFKALETANSEQETGFYPPIHVGHHVKGSPKPARVGFLRITHIEKLRFSGLTQSVIFGDLLNIKADIYKQIQDLELPYCSVEIKSWNNPKIFSLALLDSEPPHYSFPLLAVDDESIAFSINPTTSEDAEAYKACFMFKSIGERLMDNDQNKEAKILESGIKFQAEPALAPQETKEFTESLPEPSDPSEDILDGIVALFEQNKDIIGLLSSIKESMLGEDSKNQSEDKDELQSHDEDKDEKFGALYAKINILEQEMEKGNLQKKESLIISKAEESLMKAGYSITPKIQVSLREVFSQSGEKGLNAFIDGYKGNVPSDNLYETQTFSADSEQMDPLREEYDFLKSIHLYNKSFDEYKNNQ